MKITTLALLALGAVLAGCTSSADANASNGSDSSQSDYDFDPGSSQDRGKPDSGFNNVPKDVLVIMPRDRIQAIWNPTFVAADAAIMPEEAEVIGVAFNGEAKAYSINLLDGHEIVNDVVGGIKIAVTW